MSELLRRWLRDDVGVAQHVDSFESAFASGFLFGEVLARCNMQPDFAKFVNENTPDARINNFTRLQVRRRRGLLRGIFFDTARPARSSLSHLDPTRVPRRNVRVRPRTPRKVVRFGQSDDAELTDFFLFALARHDAAHAPRPSLHHPHIAPPQPSLQKLGVHLNARAVTSIVREKRGVTSRLLVQLKSAVDAMVRGVQRCRAS